MIVNGKNIMIQLGVRKNGTVFTTKVEVGGELSLEGTLINQMYPGINMALVKVTTSRLKEHEEILVKNALVRIVKNGVTYVMFGSGGGLKDGKIMFVEERYAKALHERFQNWPEALLAYAGILTSDCVSVMTVDHCRVLVVPDNELGTNDCGGWIRESLYQLLSLKEVVRDPATMLPRRNSDGSVQTILRKLPIGVLSQARIASIGHNQCTTSSIGNQSIDAKPSFKVVLDDVMDALGCDIILPESAQKPPLRDLSEYSPRDLSARMWIGRVAIGVRDFSKFNTFDCSATVSQNFPLNVINGEIIPKALAKIDDMITDFRNSDCRKLVGLIGRVNGNANDPEVVPDEYAGCISTAAKATQRFLEAVLLADASTYYRSHPYIHDQFSKLLARRAYKWSTGGMIDLPAFALSHDGYLFLDSEGIIRSGSDWLDKNYAISALNSESSLCVRYPVRDVKDMLPMRHRTDEQIVDDLMAREPGITVGDAEWVLKNQLRLTATYTLNSNKAKENGGDFDFDQVCLIDSAEYPQAVSYCFAIPREDGDAVTKTKSRKAVSPMFNMPAVAVNQLGNQVGIITDYMSTCAAYGRQDLIDKLKPELQAALDGLKHGTKPNMELVKEIMGEMKRPEFLSLKRTTHITDLPEMIAPASEHDSVSVIYNTLRSRFTELLGPKRNLADFEMIVSAGAEDVSEQTRDRMMKEVKVLKSWHGAAHQIIGDRFKPFQEQLNRATEARDKAIKSGDKLAKSEAWEAYNVVKAEYDAAMEAQKQQRGVLAGCVAAWGRGKTENRQAWVQTLNKALVTTERYRLERIAKNGRNSELTPAKEQPTTEASKGSMLLIAFPQELVNSIAAATGGIATLVEPDKRDFTFVISGSNFYSVFPIGEQRLEYVYEYATREFKYVRPAEAPAGKEESKTAA